jgi:hypothetical protein
MKLTRHRVSQQLLAYLNNEFRCTFQAHFKEYLFQL